jgi:hypothetical protein
MSLTVSVGLQRIENKLYSLISMLVLLEKEIIFVLLIVNFIKLAVYQPSIELMSDCSILQYSRDLMAL